jgi:eukaryotic-like serine/threonine-protein kinase
VSSPTDPAEPAGERLGRYQLVELVGRGGMAEVWKARVDGPHGFQRQLALKRPLGELQTDAGILAMFAKEARILSRLHHPNVVGVFDFGEVDGRPYLVMELVEGWTLSKVLSSTSRRVMPPGFAALVTRELARALAYVHSATTEDGHRLQLVHRDLSPGNVMVGHDGSVRLLDFGIAKVLEAALDERTRTGVLKGKAPYMSPEQAAGEPLDARSDQFSLGVVLYEMLTGKRPFGGEGDAVVLRRVQEATFDPPSLLEPSIPRDLEDVCLRLLAKEPAGRYPDAEWVAKKLDTIVADLAWGPGRLSELMTTLRAEEDRTPAPRPRTGRLERGSNKRWLLWAAGGVIAVGATVWAISRPSSPAATIVEPPASASVRIAIESTPSGAEVLKDKTRMGTTPLSLPIARGKDPIRFVLRAPERATTTVEVIPDDDQRISVQLVPREPPPRRPPPQPAPPKTKPRAGSEGDYEKAIKKGKIVDPFK